jgi:hypothetical protein
MRLSRIEPQVHFDAVRVESGSGFPLLIIAGGDCLGLARFCRSVQAVRCLSFFGQNQPAIGPVVIYEFDFEEGSF